MSIIDCPFVLDFEQNSTDSDEAATHCTWCLNPTDRDAFRCRCLSAFCSKECFTACLRMSNHSHVCRKLDGSEQGLQLHAAGHRLLIRTAPYCSIPPRLLYDAHREGDLLFSLLWSAEIHRHSFIVAGISKGSLLLCTATHRDPIVRKTLVESATMKAGMLLISAIPESSFEEEGIDVLLIGAGVVRSTKQNEAMLQVDVMHMASRPANKAETPDIDSNVNAASRSFQIQLRETEKNSYRLSSVERSQAKGHYVDLRNVLKGIISWLSDDAALLRRIDRTDFVSQPCLLTSRRA